MTTTTETPATSADTETARFTASLRNFADWLDANPGLTPDLSYSYGHLAPVGGHEDPKARMAEFIRAALAAKLPVRKEYDESWGMAFIDFGAFTLQVYAGRDKVCERIVVGTREVTKEVPDPEALAAVPTTTVTETVEDVRWECLPLLATEAVVSCRDCGRPLHEDDDSNTGLGYHVDCTVDGALAGQPS